MPRLVTLQQGPLGVAASTRRPTPRPGAKGIGAVADSNGARLNQPPTRHAQPQKPPEENDEILQTLVTGVAPGTLFETSRLAAVIPESISPPRPAADQRRAAWSPPLSAFSLRDRSI